MENSKKHNYLLSASIVVAAVLVAGSLIYSVGAKNTGSQNNAEQQANLQQAVQKTAKPEIGDSVVLGSSTASVTVFIYSDYQCPFCGKLFENAEKSIRLNYVNKGKVKMVYKNLIVVDNVSAGENESFNAALATACAGDQNKFWEFHDALFQTEIQEFKKKGNNERTGNLNLNTFKTIASGLKMNVNDFSTCFNSQKYAEKINQEVKDAEILITQASTPTVFVNNEMIQGAYPYSVFSQLIDAALK